MDMQTVALSNFTESLSKGHCHQSAGMSLSVDGVNKHLNCATQVDINTFINKGN